MTKVVTAIEIWGCYEAWFGIETPQSHDMTDKASKKGGR